MKDFKTLKYFWCALILSAGTMINAWGQFTPVNLTTPDTNISEAEYVAGVVFTVTFAVGQEPVIGNEIRIYQNGTLFHTHTVTVNGQQVHLVTISSTDYPGAPSGLYNITARHFNGLESPDSPIVPVTLDRVIPAGYTVTLLDPITSLNVTNASFTVAGGEIGTSCDYDITDGTNHVIGSGAISTNPQTFNSINLSSLTDGPISISITLTDNAGNVGAIATDSATKDATVPTLTMGAITTIPAAPSHGAGTATQLTEIRIPFTSSENISTPTVTINGQAATVTGGPTIWLAAHQIGSAELLANGSNAPIRYSITAFADTIGNFGADIINATTGLVGYYTLTSANSGDPAVAANWTPNAVPTVNDDLIVLAAHTMTQASQIDCYSLNNGGGWNTNGRNYSGRLTNTGTFTRNGAGTVTVGGVAALGGTVVYSGGATVALAGVTSYNNLILNTATISVNADLSIGGQLQVLAGSLSITGAGNDLSVTGTTTNNGTLSIATASTFTGAVTNTGTINCGTGTTTFSNTITNATGTINGTAGTLNLNAGINDGTLRASSVTTNVVGSFAPAAATFNPNGGTVFFTGASSTTNLTYNNLTISGGALDATAGLSVAGNFSITGLATLACGTSTLVLNGAGDQTVTTNAQTFNIISIATRAAGTVTFNNALNVADHVDAAGAGSYAVTISDGGYAVNASTFSNAGNLNLPAGFDFRGGLTQDTGNTYLGGAITSSNAPIALTDATPRTLFLTNVASINTVNAGTGGNINLGAVSNAVSRTFTLTAGTAGNISVTGEVGAGTALSAFTVALANMVTLGNRVTVTGTVGIANDGLLTIPDVTNEYDTAVYDIIAPGGFTQSGTGAVNLQGDIRAGVALGTGGISFAGPITLTGDVRLAVTAGTGGVSFANAATIDGDGVEPRDLFVAAVSGNIAFGTAPALGNARIGGTANHPRRISISTTGNVTLNGGVDIDGVAAANALDISAATIRFNNRVNVSDGNVSITNAGVLYTEEDADFTLTGASATFTQGGAGDCQLAGGITTAGGGITFTQDVYLVGTTGTMPLGRGAFDNPIIFGENLYITADGKEVIFQSAVRAANFVLFHGTVTLAASVTEPSIRTMSGDVGLFGGGYNAADADTGLPNLFAYNPTPARPPLPAIHALPPTRPDGVAIGAPYSGSIVTSLSERTISVFRNFYANGIDLNPGGLPWNLIIPDNDDATAAFAEVYNLSLRNCNASHFVAAAEATDEGANTNCVFTRPNIQPTGTYTISDDIIRVEFHDGAGTPVKIENTNDEISAALAYIRFFSGGTETPFTEAFSDAACSAPINDSDDISVFYLRTNPDVPDQRWNTDATGGSAGAADSTDKGRSGAGPYEAAAPANRTSIPRLDIPKALNTVFATLRDEAKNRIVHYHAGGSGAYNTTADRCPPVLAAVYTGQELHTEVQANQRPYDAHNFIELRYSEAVIIGDFAMQPIAPNWTIRYLRAQDDFVFNNDWGGGITPWGGGGIEIAGYARIEIGSVVAGTREDYANTLPAIALDPTAHAVYRNFSVDGNPPIDQTHRIRIAIAGVCEETAITHGTPYKAFWRGYIDSATTPSGTVTVPTNNFIRDSAGNILEPTDYVTVTSAVNNLYGPWDNSRPAFAGLKSAANPWQETPDLYEAVPAAAISGFINRLEMHFFDNAVSYNNAEAFGWQSKTGWYTGLPGKTFLTQPQAIAPERFGGSRPIAATQNTLGGIRDSSFLRAEGAFTLQTGAGDTTTGNSYSTTVNSRFFNLTASLSIIDDPYITLGIDEGSTLWPIASTVLTVSYDGTAFVTDLAGNRLAATPNLDCLDRSPPTVTLSLAGAGRNELYLLFSKEIENWATAPLDGITVNLDDGMGGTDPITPTAITAPDGNRGLLFTLPGAVTAEQLISPLSQITFSNANTVYDPDLGALVPATYYADAQDNYVAVGETHRLTDIGIGLVDVLYGSDGVNANGVLGENVGALRVFDGTGRLLDRDITIATRVNLAGSAPGTLSLYFDVNPPTASLPGFFNAAAQVTSNLWLPSVLPSFNAQGNGTARLRSPEVNLDPGQLLRNFLIPEADAEIAPGSMVDMVLRYGPLYCARLADPTDIRSVAPWSFSISETKRQRGGVTILNNVIDSRKRERTILQVEVPRAGNIVIQIFTIDGNLLRVLERGRIGRGTYTYTWDGTNGAGNPVARGIYFIRVVGPDIDEIRKVMVVKE